MLTCLISPHVWTGSRLFYPDVKPTHANYQLSRNAAPRLMTIVLYNLMRSERAIGPPSGRFLGASLHIRAAEKPSVSCSEAEISFLSLPWSISAYSAPRSFLSWCWAADASWFLSATGQPALTRQNLFSPLGFSSMYSTVLGVHHPVHSQLPQWGHFFRNTLQASIALGITKSRTVILDLLLQGNSVLSQPSELFICDQHWLKWL